MDIIGLRQVKNLNKCTTDEDIVRAISFELSVGEVLIMNFFVNGIKIEAKCFVGKKAMKAFCDIADDFKLPTWSLNSHLVRHNVKFLPNNVIMIGGRCLVTSDELYNKFLSLFDNSQTSKNNDISFNRELELLKTISSWTSGTEEGDLIFCAPVAGIKFTLKKKWGTPE